MFMRPLPSSPARMPATGHKPIKVSVRVHSPASTEAMESPSQALRTPTMGAPFQVPSLHVQTALWPQSLSSASSAGIAMLCPDPSSQ